MAESTRVTPLESQSRTWWQKLLNWSAYQVCTRGFFIRYFSGNMLNLSVRVPVWVCMFALKGGQVDRKASAGLSLAPHRRRRQLMGAAFLSRFVVALGKRRSVFQQKNINSENELLDNGTPLSDVCTQKELCARQLTASRLADLLWVPCWTPHAERVVASRSNIARILLCCAVQCTCPTHGNRKRPKLT